MTRTTLTKESISLGWLTSSEVKCIITMAGSMCAGRHGAEEGAESSTS